MAKRFEGCRRDAAGAVRDLFDAVTCAALAGTVQGVPDGGMGREDGGRPDATAGETPPQAKMP